MSTIVVIGATGYAGGHIVDEALSRDHTVIGVSRHAAAEPPAAEPPAGLQVRAGSIEDDELIDRVFSEADVVVVAVRGAVDGEPFLVNLVPGLLAAAGQHGTRLGFVGGAGSLQVTPGGPRLIDTPQFPAQAKPEAGSHVKVLETLRGASSEADWFYVSPAGGFGSYAPGERTGSYRVGEDVLLTDATGKSEISGADFAIAIVDEIERPAHHRQRLTVAY